MLEPDSFPTNERELAERSKLERYELQERHEQEYQEALIREKENVTPSFPIKNIFSYLW